MSFRISFKKSTIYLYLGHLFQWINDILQFLFIYTVKKFSTATAVVTPRGGRQKNVVHLENDHGSGNKEIGSSWK